MKHIAGTYHHTRPFHSKKGSVMIAVIIFVIILSGISGTYLKVALGEHKTAYRATRLQAAMNVAEAGAEEAMYAFLNDNWNNWTSVSAGHWYRKMNLSTYYADTSEVTIYANISNSNSPVILSEGVVKGHYGNVGKQLRMDLSRRGLFANGLTARNSVQFKGSNVLVDSYNSAKGIYDIVFNRNDRGTVGSTSVSVAAVDIQNATVLGFVATGGAFPQVGSKGSILGFDSPPSAKIDASRVTTDFYAEFPAVTSPTLNSPSTSIGGSAGTPHAVTPERYKLTGLNIGSGSTLDINGPVVMVVTGDIDIKGTVNIGEYGSLTIYAEGNVAVGGNGVLNATNIPANMLLYGAAPNPGSQEIKLHGNGAFIGAVYAPNANLDLKGGGNSGVMLGAAVAWEIFINGNYEFHYDEALDDFSDDDQYRISRWRELVGANEKIDFSDLSSLTANAQPL